MRKKSTTTFDDYIKYIIQKNEPETVEQLVNLVKLKYSRSRREEILEQILELHGAGKIVLKEKPKTQSSTGRYVFSRDAWWYWTVVVLAVTTIFLVFTVPEDAFPLVYARYLLGSIFVLALPGYGFIKALFPKEVPFKTRSEELDNIERIALSIGMSLALVPMTGLFLNYTPWGIRLTPVTLSLLLLTITFSTVGVIREHQARQRAS